MNATDSSCAARLGALLLCLAMSAAALGANNEQYDIVFSTYIGGGNWEHARDVFADRQGNIYMVGGTASTDYPTTPGAYDQDFNGGGKQIGAAGQCDAFVTKFDPEGKLIWSTLLGGPNYDRAYAVEVDARGYVYVAGRAGPGFPVTEGAFQTDYGGSRYNGFYGSQNGFAAKLSPDGERLIWSSFVGVGELCRDLAIDADGDVYLPLGWNTRSPDVQKPDWFAHAFSGALQKKPAGNLDCGIVKVKGDGSRVLWATWLGGSGKDTQESSIRVDTRNRVYIVFNTNSKDLPTTPGAFARTHNGGDDGYVAAIQADGSGLVYGTYLGGSGVDWAVSTHTLAIDVGGNAYVCVCTKSTDFPTTPGAFDGNRDGPTDIAIVKLSPTGALLRSTLIGGSGSEGADGIYVDRTGKVFFVGQTDSNDFPVTSNACQGKYAGGKDAVIVRLSSDFSRLLYSTYLGGAAFDTGRSAYLGQDGSLYLTGAVNGPGWPVKNAYQSTFAGGGGRRWGNGDCILTRLKPTD